MSEYQKPPRRTSLAHPALARQPQDPLVAAPPRKAPGERPGRGIPAPAQDPAQRARTAPGEEMQVPRPTRRQRPVTYRAGGRQP